MAARASRRQRVFRFSPLAGIHLIGTWLRNWATLSSGITMRFSPLAGIHLIGTVVYEDDGSVWWALRWGASVPWRGFTSLARRTALLPGSHPLSGRFSPLAGIHLIGTRVGTRRRSARRHHWRRFSPLAGIHLIGTR
jgi:hypothetical protein